MAAFWALAYTVYTVIFLLLRKLIDWKILSPSNLIQSRVVVVVVWLTALAPVRLGTKQTEHVQQPPMLITRRANVTRELPQTLITGTAELVPINKYKLERIQSTVDLLSRVSTKIGSNSKHIYIKSRLKSYLFTGCSYVSFAT